MSKEVQIDRLRKESKLYPQEIKVLFWLSKGLTTKLIAAKMKITYGTAKNYIADIKDKTGVYSKLGLILLYLGAPADYIAPAFT